VPAAFRETLYVGIQANITRVALQGLAFQPGQELAPDLRGGQSRFRSSPASIRIGPWVGWKKGEVPSLRLPHPCELGEQGFFLMHRPTSKFEPEAVPRIAVESAECPESGEVDMRGSLRKKEFPTVRRQGVSQRTRQDP